MMIKMKEKKLTIIFIVIISLITLFIWSQSMMPKNVSQSESDSVVDIVEPVVKPVANAINVPVEILVRKIAHFLEFFTLGVATSLFIVLTKRFTIHNSIHVCSYGMAVALIDESIQILSNRGPAVKDVLIDMSGFLLAVVGVLVISYLVLHYKGQKKNGHENI